MEVFRVFPLCGVLLLILLEAGSAAAQGPITMGIDPEISGNSASTLGTIESCTRVDVPAPAFDDVSDYNIDVYVTGDVDWPNGYYALLTYDATKVHIASPGTDDRIKMPGATSITELLPSDDGTFEANAVYLTQNFGIPGDGILLRLGLDIGGSGLVTFDFVQLPDYQSCQGPPSCAGGWPLHPVTTVSASLAINTDCPGAATPTPTPLPVGGIAELADVSGSSGPNHTTLGALAAAALIALTAGAWYARLRWVQRS